MYDSGFGSRRVDGNGHASSTDSGGNNGDGRGDSGGGCGGGGCDGYGRMDSDGCGDDESYGGNDGGIAMSPATRGNLDVWNRPSSDGSALPITRDDAAAWNTLGHSRLFIEKKQTGARGALPPFVPRDGKRFDGTTARAHSSLLPCHRPLALPRSPAPALPLTVSPLTHLLLVRRLRSLCCSGRACVPDLKPPSPVRVLFLSPVFKKGRVGARYSREDASVALSPVRISSF